MKKYLVFMMLLSLILSACRSGEAPLVGSWKLTAYGPESSTTPAVEDSKAGLTFNEDGTVNGSSGCNGVGGEYTVERDQVEFGQFVSTLMFCEETIMAQESAMMQVLNGTAAYEVDGETLTLTKDGTVLVLTAGEWQ